MAQIVAAIMRAYDPMNSANSDDSPQQDNMSLPMGVRLKNLELTFKGGRAGPDDWRELARLAVPVFKELRSSVPYYAALMHHDNFWYNFVTTGPLARIAVLQRLEREGMLRQTEASTEKARRSAAEPGLDG